MPFIAPSCVAPSRVTPPRVAPPSAAPGAVCADRPAGPVPPVLWLRRIRTRRALAALHPDQVRQAGIDPARLRAEILKPFWRR